MSQVLIGIAWFLGGSLAGAVVLARWYFWYLRKPEVLRDVLKGFHRQAHPHWLQTSPDDPVRVCPCCGWSETETLATWASAPSRQLFGIKVVSVCWVTLPSGPITGTADEMEKHAKKIQADHDSSAARLSGPYVAYLARPYTGSR